MLYVGRATEAKLQSYYIRTIGDLAKTDPGRLSRWFGKVGLVLHSFANGEDRSLVAPTGFESPIKSVGNSQICPRDLKSDTDVKIFSLLKKANFGRMGLRKKMLNAALDLAALTIVVFGEK